MKDLSSKVSQSSEERHLQTRSHNANGCLRRGTMFRENSEKDHQLISGCLRRPHIRDDNWTESGKINTFFPQRQRSAYLCNVYRHRGGKSECWLESRVYVSVLMSLWSRISRWKQRWAGPGSWRGPNYFLEKLGKHWKMLSRVIKRFRNEVWTYHSADSQKNGLETRRSVRRCPKFIVNDNETWPVSYREKEEKELSVRNSGTGIDMDNGVIGTPGESGAQMCQILSWVIG